MVQSFLVIWRQRKKQRLFPQIIQKLENRKIAQIDNSEIGLDYTNVKYAAKMIVKVISNKKQGEYLIFVQEKF